MPTGSYYLLVGKRVLCWAFIVTGLHIVLTQVTFFMLMFPSVMISSLNPERIIFPDLGGRLTSALFLNQNLWMIEKAASTDLGMLSIIDLISTGYSIMKSNGFCSRGEALPANFRDAVLGSFFV